jgi:hypothetical protein
MEGFYMPTHVEKVKARKYVIKENSGGKIVGRSSSARKAHISSNIRNRAYRAKTAKGKK